MTPLLLALDPSLRCTGGVLVTLDGRADLVDAWAVETEAEPTAGHALAEQHAQGRRAGDLFAGLLARLEPHRGRIAVVAIETPLGAKDAGAAWAMARSNAVVHCALAVVAPHLRPMAVSAFEAKLAATGQKVPEDGKRAVAEAVRRRWGIDAWLPLLPSTPRGQEAVYDAAAVALVALRTKAARLVIRDHAAADAVARTQRGNP